LPGKGTKKGRGKSSRVKWRSGLGAALAATDSGRGVWLSCEKWGGGRLGGSPWVQVVLPGILWVGSVGNGGAPAGEWRSCRRR